MVNIKIISFFLYFWIYTINMINRQLINPLSIAIIGGSENIHKPGGKILRNIVDGNFSGNIFSVNPKEANIAGVTWCQDVELLPEVDLAILSIPSKQCPEIVDILALQKNTKAFIIISAGFSEEGYEGALLEKKIVERINSVGGCLIGPDCIGVITSYHHSVFTSPVPKIDPHGCDLVSSSGGTAIFIMESGISKGLRFSSVFSVGNSAQIGVEDVLEYFDSSFNPENSSRIKLLYIESIKDSDKLLLHASSLIKKGCRIAGIKAGVSKAGSRAAMSHTGAIASSDLAVEALFRKAGIVRCSGREELTTVASIFMHPEIKGKNIAIITHAGGPAVMLSDALSKGGLEVPEISGKEANELKAQLVPFASVQNPIDLLATGTSQQLATAIEFCDKKFSNIDAIMIIFGSPGLVEVFDVYEVLDQKMHTCTKPIFPILPSIITAKKEVEYFINKGHVNFHDEVLLGSAIIKVMNTPRPAEENTFEEKEILKIRNMVDNLDNGYIPPKQAHELLKLSGIDIVDEVFSSDKEELVFEACKFGYPIVAKVIGPVHKSDVGGVAINVRNEKLFSAEFDRLMAISGAKGVLIQPMLKGIELFLGAKYESAFGHVILCGLGGIFVEVLDDVSSGLAPLSYAEAYSMIRSLKSYKIIKGIRGKEGIQEEKFADIIVRLSKLLRFATEIKEIDLNPLIGNHEKITVVDARIFVSRE